MKKRATTTPTAAPACHRWEPTTTPRQFKCSLCAAVCVRGRGGELIAFYAAKMLPSRHALTLEVA